MTTNGVYSNPLPTVRRFITAHNDGGQAVYSQDLAEDAQFFRLQHDPKMPVGFYLGYTTSDFPAPLTNDRDLRDYKTIFAQSEASGLVKKGGTIMRYVDYPPKCRSPMHRTVSLDYGFMLHGTLECLLDSGESRILKPGDVAVQRGTMHQWINHSDTDWARMVYVLLDSSPVTIGAVELEEDLADAKGVPASH